MLDHTFSAELKCPTCSTVNTQQTALDHDKAPTAGAICLCANCGTISVLRSAEQSELEPITEAELAELPAELRAQLAAIQASRRQRDAYRSVQEASYMVTIRKMALGAVAWVDAHGSAGLAFSMPPDDGVMFIAPLTADAIELMATNDKSREFLRALDAATEEEGTAYQACQVVRAMGLRVVDWSEEFWQSMLAEGNMLLAKRGARAGGKA